MLVIAALLLQVQMGAQVSPETVTVGQHFNVMVRVRVPNGAQLRFPDGPDTAAHVAAAGRPQHRVTIGPQFTETAVSYVLAAWDTGSQSLGLGDVTVASSKRQQLAALRKLTVYVRSVLPTDTSKRQPKPARPTIPIGGSSWFAWAIGAALLALAALGYWVWRRRRGAAPPPVTPAEWAQREFARIEAHGWIAAGEPERYSIDMTDIARRYLSQVDPALRESLTTRELAHEVARSPILPAERIVTLFESVDPLKFAARHVAPAGAMAIGAEARAVVTETDARLSATRAAARAAVVNVTTDRAAA